MLGREIARLLERSGMTQAQAAALFDKKQPKIAELLDATAAISYGDLKVLAEGLGVTDPGLLDWLQELRRDNQKRGFWDTGYRRAYAEDFRMLVDLEAHAEVIRTVECETMPGLAQCEAYIRAQFAGRDESPAPSRAEDDDPVTVEDMVQSRLARQRVVLDGDVEYRVVLSESCLRRQLGGPAVMREQLAHLDTLSKLDRVLMQVIPFNVAQRWPILSRPFVLLQLPSRGAEGPLQVVYVEGHGEIRYLDETNALNAHDHAWARLSSIALSPDDTRAFIHHTTKNTT
jgi:transcriptional regulator with XRE-family HTH domain